MAVLSAIFLVALAARLLCMILEPLLQRDAALYLTLTERWHETGDYAETIVTGIIEPPFPLFTIKKMMDWGIPVEIAGRSIALFLGSMIPVIGYCISCKVFKDALISGISTLLFILHPALVSYSVQPLRESFYLFFWGLTVMEAINGIVYGRYKDWMLCGVFLAFGFYCRYESLELLAFCPMVVCYMVFKNKLRIRKAMMFLFVFFFSMAATGVLLLNITDFDLSFITKISTYSDRMIEQTNVREFIQIDTENDE